MKLFHGSLLDIAGSLKPHKAFDREDYDESIYFTDEEINAVLYSINPIRAYIKKHYAKDLMVSATSAHKMNRNGVWEVFELYPGMFDDLFNQKSYIYVVETENGYESRGENEFTIQKEIAFNEKIVIDNLYKELLKLQDEGKVKLFSFNDIIQNKPYFEFEHIEDNLQSRAKFCKYNEEFEFFIMLSKFHYELNPEIKMAQ